MVDCTVAVRLTIRVLVSCHIAVAAMERDRIKDAALLRQSVTPLRFTDFRVEHEVRGILSDLRHFLGLRC